MFVDYGDPETPADIRCDLCIVGAGAAGITLALSLAESGLDICVLESGGFEFAGDIQSLYDGESVGMENASPLGCRLRFLGGTTNHWHGWCAPLQAVDFERRPWVPDSGWPIARSELDAFYARAGEFCEIGSADAPASAALPSFDRAKAIVGVWRFSPPTRFGSAYRQQLKDAGRVTVYLHCNVCQLVTNATASELRSLNVRTLAGKTGTVTARSYVLACGGMENARLLLLTDEVERGGLGNGSGRLGRNFLQHIEGVVARVQSNDTAAIVQAFERNDGDGGAWMAHAAISPAAQRTYGLLNTGFAIGRPGTEMSEAYIALRNLWRGVKSGHWPDDLGDSIWSVVSDLDGVASDIYRRGNEAPAYLNLDIKAEQAPNAASTITLGNDRDAFGLRKIRVNWQLSAHDKRSIRRSTELIAEEFGRLDLGRIQLAEWLRSDDPMWPEHIWSGCHHMGTTRMSDDARTGIVNTDCRAHTVANLYVAGSAVFPTGGYVPPTLTIVALALRLADHLKVRYA